MTSNKRVLVTGITGQDGSYLAEHLLGDGWDVYALVRSVRADGEQPIDARVQQFVGDLSDRSRLKQLVEEIKPSCIFNLAGISSVAQSWQEPVATVEVTGMAPVALLEAAWKVQETSGESIRFVQASSSEMFGTPTELPQTETTEIRPVSPYGAAKALAHHAVSIYRSRGLFASAAILYNHESPRRPPSFVTRKITNGVARIAAGLQDKLVLGNLDARRDWGWAPDYVDALVRISTAAEPDDFIIATGQSHTVRDFVEAAFTAAGISDWRQLVGIDERFMRPVDAPELRGSAEKARAVLGWQPTVEFAEVVARMVRHDLATVSEAPQS